ncbi:MAG: helix-turn-helix transcriptional regulator [Candidatus Marinimicrobia bacterium]|nr:helix-turn-helix transcriptional regulator [Candidatus Neomarinimicrobiota bacterium]
MSTKKINIGKLIHDYRISKHISATKFAEIIGISRASLYNYEDEKRSPNIDTINKISDIFPDFKTWGTPTEKQPATDGSAMYESTDGYYVSRDPKTGLLTRIKKDDTDIVEVRIGGQWVPDQVP